jgi:hypothetical protein
MCGGGVLHNGKEKQGGRRLRFSSQPENAAFRDSLRTRPRAARSASGLGLIESLLAEKLWVADFYCTRFEVLGGLVIIPRENADHAF